MNKIAVIGSGGHTISSINLLKRYFDEQNISIYDDSYNGSKTENIRKIPLVGSVNEINPDEYIFLSIGDVNLRKKYFLNFEERVFKKNVFHKSSRQEKEVNFGRSNQIFANSYINSKVSIGNNNIINSGAIIEHESKIGSHNHVAIGVQICGRVRIGNLCFIGAGSIVLNNISICDGVVVGAGSVVVKDICDPGVYVGNPAMKIK